MADIIDRILCLYERHVIALESIAKSPSPKDGVITLIKGLSLDDLHTRQILMSNCVDFDCLSCRAKNCLKAAGIDRIADLVSLTRSDMMKFRNFGKKALNELDILVERLGLQFGMDVTKYGIIPNRLK